MPQLTPNQVVAHNLRRARQVRGWTQEHAADRLAPFLGERWSHVVFSAAERSTAGKRIRQFDADQLLAIAAAFELPLSFFFAPPRDVEAIAVAGASETLSPEDVVALSAGPDEARRRAHLHFDEGPAQRMRDAGIDVHYEER